MRAKATRLLVLALVIGIGWWLWQIRPASYPDWSAEQLSELQSLALRSLPPLPASPGNAVADDPRAAAWGEKLFNDPRLSANGGIACATCHQPLRNFSDGLPKGQALGTVDRNTPSIVGVAYSPWQFWDGRSDSLWAQALAPLEDPREHGHSREQVAALVREDDDYRQSYEELFGELPTASAASTTDRIFSNVGKVIAAFERTVLPGETRFDRYVDALLAGESGVEWLSADGAQGLALFIGKANCTQCHNGPLLTNHEFHNTGVLSSPGELPDFGRAVGVKTVLADPFNCFGDFNDAVGEYDNSQQCPELEFVRTGPELLGAFKTPSLRNLQHTAPYMHKGQHPTLVEVLAHYNAAPDAMIGHNEAKPLGLSQRQLRQLQVFLESLHHE